MLKVIVDIPENMIIDIPSYFYNVFDMDYLLTDFSKRVIKDIDGCDVFSKNVVISPVFGGISPYDMSSGVMTLLLIKYYDIVTDFHFLGENCYKFLPEIVNDKDVLMSIEHGEEIFGESGLDRIYIVNSDFTATDDASFIREIRRVARIEGFL